MEGLDTDGWYGKKEWKREWKQVLTLRDVGLRIKVKLAGG